MVPILHVRLRLNPAVMIKWYRNLKNVDISENDPKIATKNVEVYGKVNPDDIFLKLRAKDGLTM